MDIFPDVRQRRNQEPAGTTRWINNLFARLRVKNIHHHFHDVARREELPLCSAQRRTNEYLERAPDGPPVCVQNAVFWKFAYDVPDPLSIQANRFCSCENIVIR